MSVELRVQRIYRADLDVKTGKRIIEGVAIPYGAPELVSDDGRTSYLEEWLMGAFARATEPANVGRVKLNYTHDDDTSLMHWIGRAIKLEETSTGLRGQWRVDDSPFGDAVLAKVADGQLPGLSVDAAILAHTLRGDVRVRTRAHLRHVALVEEPAFTGALVTAVRARQTVPGAAAVWSSRLAAMRDAREKALTLR